MNLVLLIFHRDSDILSVFYLKYLISSTFQSSRQLSARQNDINKPK